jgi:N-methylhydantoinase B
MPDHTASITYDVIRNRLLAITQEMRLALQSVSGSPTVVEASDFFTGIFTPDGEFASMGFQVTLEAPVVGSLIRGIGQRKHLTVNDGDMFVGNDPYVGALHQNDLQMTGPIFADGVLLGWAGVMAHETDMGGMDFASWSPKAREVYQEGMRIPAVKLVDRGETREDVIEMILAASRLPDALGLDIRAFIATINVARERLAALARRYGASTIKTTMKSMIAGAEQRVRARLRELPDAVVHVADYLEHDGHADRLYRVELTLTKRDDALVFDFGNSSAQAPGFINATRAGLHGGVAGAMLSTLGYDIPWNAGILRPATILAPDGLICTATFPAPVGSATVETIWVVNNVAAKAINALLATSEAFVSRVQTVGSGTMATFNLGGVNALGENFGLHLMDPIAGGSGAFSSKDGIHAGGAINTPSPSIADVERNEQVSPLFYFHRRVAQDTAGAGRHRGGAAASVSFTLHGIERANALIMTHGLEVPNATGAYGGWPAATIRQSMVRGAVHDSVFDAARGTTEAFGPKPGLIEFTRHDAFVVSWQGGGGWGDPLERDPYAVAADIRDGSISPAAARDLCGVAWDGELDAAATQRMRDDVRRARLAGTHPDPQRIFHGERLRPLGDALFLGHDARGWHVCSDAGYILSTNDTRWRSGAIAQRLERWPAALNITLHPELTMTAYYCPASGRQLAVDVHERDREPLDDVILDLSSLVPPTARREEPALTLSRTAFVAGATAALLARARPAQAQAAKLPPLVIGCTPANDFLPAFVAADQGLFAKHGLDVTIQLIPIAPTLIGALRAGSIQVGSVTPPALILANDGGLDLVTILGGTRARRTNPTISLIARTDSGIKTAADLRGKRVGVPGLSSVLDIVFREWLVENKVDPKTVTIIEAPFPTMNDQLKGGTLDAVAAVEPFRALMLKDGVGYKVADYFSAVKDGLSIVLYAATRQWAEANKPTIAALRASIVDAIAFIDQNPDKARAVEVAHLRVAGPTFASYDVALDTTDLAYYATLTTDLGLLRQPADVAKYIEH